MNAQRMESTDYFDQLLNRNSKTNKKQVGLYLDETTVERLDMVAQMFSSINASRSFSRSTIIEMAVEKFLKEAEQYLLEEQRVDVAAFIEAARLAEFDTAILAASGRGFEETFLGEKEAPCWYPCRISDARAQKVKYIAVYRGQPVSAITHYAKVKEIKYDEVRKCKVCVFDGDPIELPNKVVLGDKETCFFVGAKYTSLDQLLNATQADQMKFV